ncbi:MAG: hypothetical protein MJ172_11755 [Clostridia bacterium]|nr:hypothetical protein [Clostridia bacterium]
MSIRTTYLTKMFSFKSLAALCLGVSICIYNIYAYFAFANYIGEPIQILEAFVMTGNYLHFFLPFFLGNLFLVSDAPFIDDMCRYEIIRIGRQRWITDKIIYIILASITYTFLIFLSTLISSIICCQVYISNHWSNAILILAEEQPIFAANSFRLIFPYPGLTSSLSPLAAMIMTFIFCTLYSIFIAMILLVFNVFWQKKYGFIVASVVHILGYVFILTIDGPPVKFSILSWAMIKNYFMGMKDYISPLTSALLFITIIVILAELGKIAFNHYEL